MHLLPTHPLIINNKEDIGPEKMGPSMEEVK